LYNSPSDPRTSVAKSTDSEPWLSCVVSLSYAAAGFWVFGFKPKTQKPSPFWKLCLGFCNASMAKMIPSGKPKRSRKGSRRKDSLKPPKSTLSEIWGYFNEKADIHKEIWKSSIIARVREFLITCDIIAQNLRNALIGMSRYLNFILCLLVVMIFLRLSITNWANECKKLLGIIW
jgi:hypothetical protein